jgi:hypothetical protein
VFSLQKSLKIVCRDAVSLQISNNDSGYEIFSTFICQHVNLICEIIFVNCDINRISMDDSLISPVEDVVVAGSSFRNQAEKYTQTTAMQLLCFS